MSARALHEQFAERRTRWPDAMHVRALKAAAFDQFASTGFPTRRDENWRYTDLKRIADAGYALEAPSPTDSVSDRVAALLEAKGLGREGRRRCVFIDGHLSSRLSTLDGIDGMTIGSLQANWDALDRPRAGGGPHPLAALNTAFAEHGLVVSVADGVRPDAELELVFVGADSPDVAPQPRIVVELGANAGLRIVEHFIDLGPCAAWLNLVTDVTVGPGSSLELLRLQEHAEQRIQTSLLRAQLARDASLIASAVDLGGQLVRNDFDVQLTEPGASVEILGVFLASAGQHVDNHLSVEHRAPHTRSREAFRGIVGEGGHGVFNGKVVVHPDAQQVDAQQSSDNLLLSENAEIDTKPELEIHADDVKCSHGATIGELDERQLFYLCSRGLDATAARSLLTFAFANTILERIGREEISSRVAARLPDHERREALE